MGGGEGVDNNDAETNLCACLFNSCRRVSAGLESGLGPRRFGFSPSRQMMGALSAACNAITLRFQMMREMNDCWPQGVNTVVRG